MLKVQQSPKTPLRLAINNERGHFWHHLLRQRL